MALLPLIILALIQGLTEFLPVSSSGHLVLVHAFFEGTKSWDERIIFDVAVHIGTLFSVLLYFRHDVMKMLRGLVNFKSEGATLNLHIIIASIPVILCGLALHMIKPSWLLAVEIMAWSTLLFGILLWFADRTEKKDKTLEDMNLKDAVLIGLAQALALIPGTSRSGITMTASRFLGYSRSESAHFSLLLAIIAISGAGVIGSAELMISDFTEVAPAVLTATALAFITGWLSIAGMMAWLKRCNFTIFAVYRVILGAALLGMLYSGMLA